MISLARGFAYAGCPTIVMSLWPAFDKPTSRIIQYFYQGLSDGLSKDEALYYAKIEYLESVDEYQANPALWGSFVLIGNIEPLHHQYSKTSSFWIVGLFFLLLTTILIIWKSKHYIFKNNFGKQ